MDRQIPGVSHQSAGENGAACRQVNNTESEPYLPEDLVDSVSRVRVMDPVLYGGDGMQYEAMSDVFGQGPCREAATEQKNSNGRLKG